MSIGFSFPMQQSTGSLGHFQATEDELSAVKSNILALALTNWGERPMHYNMGFNLIEFIFEQTSAVELREKIADRVLDQLSMWMPFVSVRKLNILLPEDNEDIEENSIGLYIEFSLVNKPDLNDQELFVISFA